MRHLRVTHSKFSTLKESREATNDESGLALPGTSAAFGGPPEPPDFFRGPILTNLEPLNNINPWSQRLEGDCDFGPREAENCLHWVGEKVLEHAGFQGMALSTPFSTDTYVFFRDIKISFRRVYWCCFTVFIERREDNTVPIGKVWKEDVSRGESKIHNIVFHRIYAATQEIMLHTLFESGITRVEDLEQYIQDDVVRYGSRLSELGKKLDNAYQEIVRSTKFTFHLSSLIPRQTDKRRRRYR